MKTFLSILITCAFVLEPLSGQNDWYISVKGSSDISDVSLERLEGDFLILGNAERESSVSLISIERMSRKPRKKNYVGNFLTGALIGAGTAYMTYKIFDARANPNSSDDESKGGLAAAGGGVVGGIIGIAASASQESEIHEMGKAGIEEKRRVVRSILVKEGKEPVPGVAHEIVYLKNGSIIKGTILELFPDSVVSIQTADSSLFVYNMSDVEKISMGKESPPVRSSLPETEPDADLPSPMPPARWSFGLRVGLAAPVGDF